MLKAVLILVVVFIVLAVGGWLTVNRSPSKATITLETEKIQDDASHFIERGNDLVRDVAREDPAGDPLRETLED